MTKIQIIKKINRMLRDTEIDHGFLKYHSRSKATFEILLEKTELLVDIKSACDELEQEFSIVEIGLASVDGTNDPVMLRILHYRRQMSDIVDELDLGAPFLS